MGAILFDKDRVAQLRDLSDRPDRLRGSKLLWIDLYEGSELSVEEVAEELDLDEKTRGSLASPDEKVVLQRFRPLPPHHYELSGEANKLLAQALTAIERTLDGAGIATAKVWVGEHVYMLERPAFNQLAATPASQFVARSLGPDRDLSEELSRPSSGARFIRRANNSVYDVFVKLGCEDGEFWCECDDPCCEERVTLTLREYAALRGRPDTRLLARSHAEVEVPQ